MALRTHLNPLRLTWTVSAVVGGIALGLTYGFKEPVVPDADRIIRIMLVTSAALFILSRLLLLVPATGLADRLHRWWLDYMLIAAGVIWWTLDRSKTSVILEVAALYNLAIGAGSVLLAGFGGLLQVSTYDLVRPAGLRLLAGAVVAALIGGTVLSLPACWDGPYPVTWDGTYPGQTRYELAMHFLDCTFTATAALTGTGLAVHDIGCEFNRTGQAVLLLLMHVGGLAVLAIGTSVCWRLRALCGWGAVDDDTSPNGIRRLIAFVIVAALVLEAIGAATLYGMWGPDLDANFAEQGDRLFASVFHAVSAFCNVGLTLTRDGLIAYRGCYAVYAAILPLMVIGGMGLPVLWELCRRLLRHRGLGLESLSRHSALTVFVTSFLIVAGALLLQVIETTPQCQLRNPRTHTPGRLVIPASQSRPATMPLSQQAVERADAQRMRTMPTGQRWLAALFHSAAARTAGMRTARLDESSLSPASRFVLIAMMVIGGGVSGTAGGLRLVLLFLLIGAVFSKPIVPVYNAGDARRVAGRQQALTIAASVAFLMFVLIGLTAGTLIYRETGSPQACAFEAVSACCNVGFSTGLTQQLSVQGRAVLILAMLLGRVVPLALLLRCRQVPVPPPPGSGPVVILPGEREPKVSASESIPLVEPDRSESSEGTS